MTATPAVIFFRAQGAIIGRSLARGRNLHLSAKRMGRL